MWASVAAVEFESAEVQRLAVAVDDGTEGSAVNYLRTAPSCAAGDRVLLNTTAVDLSLGTGGRHFVVARLGTAEGIALDVPAGGHVMKLRYTPLQLDVLSVESQESPHHAVMAGATTVAGMPVVCCGLHSQVPLVAAAAKHLDPSLTIAYCMSDHAALALGLSDVMRATKAAGLIDFTVTCGQAFGGDYEAVNVYSGLLAARHVAHADIAIVAIGPGVVGTATPFGHGGICVGEAINSAHVLGGVPVACLRISFADQRGRHRGVSHHSVSALTQIALAPARVAVPSLPDEFAAIVDDELEAAGVWQRHVRVDAEAGRVASPPMMGVSVTTMGRGIDRDPAFFAAAFAAGEVAVKVAHGGSQQTT